MEITVQREAFLKPLQAVSSVVEKKQTMPILSNVLLTTQDQRLLLTGTDHEIELIGFVPIENLVTPGSVTVSAKKLFDICRSLPEGCLVRLSLEKNNLMVRAGDSYFVLNTLPVEDFPNLDEIQYPITFNFKQNNLKQILTKTYFAMGQQDVRHYLNGAFLDISPSTIKCIAADGHRLAMTTVYDDGIGSIEANVILPRKSVIELIRILGGEQDDDITVQIGEGRFRLTSPDYIFTSKLINAQYPDYNRLIPRGTTTAVIEKEAMKQALMRASILSNEKFRGVRFQLEPNRLLISANNSDQEQAEEAVSVDYSGSKMEIGFNVAYLLDAVSAISEKFIRCVFTDADNGMRIESVDDANILYVVMPMRF
jgi:DNA polymerase-3 subunit beta